MSESVEITIEKLNEMIIDAHNAHYLTSKTGLIMPNESPNGNTIYHLYSDGSITYQKGGWAYRQRSEFNYKYKIDNASDSFIFPFTAADDTTYVILTIEECEKFRKMMIDVLKK